MTTHVLARLAPGRGVGRQDFTDITTVKVTDVAFDPGGLLRVTFEGTLTSQEVWRVRVRIQSENAADENSRLAILAARNKAAAAGATFADLQALVLLLAKRELGET